MRNVDIGQQLEREIAATQLHLAARQYGTTVELIHAGESTQAMLRASQGGLEDAALRYAAAHGWQAQEVET